MAAKLELENMKNEAAELKDQEAKELIDVLDLWSESHKHYLGRL